MATDDTNHKTTPLAGKDLTFGYEPNEAIIRGLSVQLQAGQLCALVGPNAAGKSTLLQLLIGQLRPWRGVVELDRQDISQWSAWRRAQRMSYVPQRAVTSFAFTVQQVVAMGRYAMAADSAAVEAAIDRCGLSALRHREYNRLSAGQQQRVLLSRAIAQATGTGGVMLLDEPGSAMDLSHVHQMMQTLLAIARSGMAVLVVLHDLNLAVRYADTAWAIDAGRIVASGSWQSVFRQEVLEPLYRVRLRTITSQGDNRPVFTVEPQRETANQLSWDAPQPQTS